MLHLEGDLAASVPSRYSRAALIDWQELFRLREQGDPTQTACYNDREHDHFATRHTTSSSVRFSWLADTSGSSFSSFDCLATTVAVGDTPSSCSSLSPIPGLEYRCQLRRPIIACSLRSPDRAQCSIYGSRAKEADQKAQVVQVLPRLAD